MTTAFSTDVRILTCPGCGAPVHTSPVGGMVTCDHCRAIVQISARDDSLLGQGGPQLTDAERWQGLWSQATAYSQQSIPQEWVGVIPVSADTLARALTLWQSYCQGATAGNTVSAGYLTLITGAIANYFGSIPDRVRQRALFESAMEALPTPFGKQVMRGQLARAAVAVGELDAAGVWLGGMDPKSSDLEADTAYRLTYACVATAHNDFDNVLTVLGPDRNAIPITWPAELLIDIYRANATEKRGDVRTAVALLVTAAQSARGGQGATQLPEIVRRSTLNLVPQSLPYALNQLGLG